MHPADLDHIVFDFHRRMGADILSPKFHLTRDRVCVAFVTAKIGQAVRVLSVLRHNGHVDQRLRFFQCAIRRQKYAVQVSRIVKAHAIYQVKVGLRFGQLHNFTCQYDFLLIQHLHLPSF